jgi:adenine-specific DNA-methyltransferase
MLTTPTTFDLTKSVLAVLAAIPNWWARRLRAHGIEPDTAPVWDAVDVTPPFPPAVLTDILERAELREASAEALGDAYIRAHDTRVRAETGRHYTPAALAEYMWQQTLASLGDVAGGLIMDPACGTGALLVPPLRSWVARNRLVQPEIALSAVTSVVAGCDLDAIAVWLGNILLASELLPLWAGVPPERRKPLPALLSTSDGLRQDPPKARVVLMNPPYGRVRLAAEDRDRWSHVVHGHANKYALFMAAGVEQLQGKDCALTALVPAGWLGGAYFQRLRSFLSRRAPLTHVGFLGDRTGVFATGVLQETLVATFVSDGESGHPVSCEHLVVRDHRVDHTHVGEGRIPKDSAQPWLLPRRADDMPLIDSAAAMRMRLADHGWSVSTGPLVWNRHRAQLSKNPRQDSVKVVWASDLDGGRLHQDEARDELRHCTIRNEREAKILVLDSAAVLVQRTTAPEQPRRLLAAELDRSDLARWGGRVVVENHVNVLRCARADSSLTPRVLVALLDSSAVDRLYRCLTGSVAVSAYELAALPMPDAATTKRWQHLDDDQLLRAIEAYFAQVPP